MASTKKTRQVASRRCQTIVLKDLQSLHKWSESLSKHKGRDQAYSSLITCDHLLCEESPEDLEDVWATPAVGKRAKKAGSKQKTSQLMSCRKAKSGESEDIWVTPVQGKRAKRTSSRLTLPQTMTPFSPASHNAAPPVSLASCSAVPPISPASRSIVPPNSPAELSPAGQTTSNPYITYLIQKWEAGSPVVAKCTTQSIKPGTDIACNDEVSSPVLVSLQQDEVNVMLIHADDVLVIPDSSGQAVPSPTHTAQCGEGEEPAQCVPQEDDDESRQSQSQELSQRSLFAEEGFITSLPPQQTTCQQDHVVPKFELEE